jgi:2-keto-4-pentenoate hydratase/2-oxohepta-3-ene-1,7-dioic acid hydratase in catechol pathway
LHHEVELVVKLSSQLHVIEAALALDLTDRKAQTHAKKTGEPWTLAKSFHGACAVTAFFSAKDLDLLIKRKMRLWVNDELRQEESPDKMIFSIPEIVTHLKEFFPVCAGDLILTGTPSGVGPIQRGDKVTVELEGELTHTWRVI